MITYAVRAVPARTLVAGSALMALLLLLVGQSPRLWIAVCLPLGLLAAVVAWAMDEPAAAVVDAAPRGLGWRTSARILLVLPVLGVWTAFAVWFGQMPSSPGTGHGAVLVVMGGAAAALALSATTVQRRLGRPTPGQSTATVLALLLAGERLWPGHKRFLPMSTEADWNAAAWFWGAATLTGLAILLVALRDQHGRDPVVRMR